MGDPIVPEYVVEGTAVAQAAQQAAAASAATATPPQTPVQGPKAAVGTPQQPITSGPPAMSPRPGYLAWSMQISDDGKMAIIQIAAADHHAFDSILADTRPEIRVFEIGKDSASTIEKELQKFKKNFDLENFQVVVQ